MLCRTEQKFYVCKHCGNLVGMLHDSGVKMICCGEEMQGLVANTTDASQEKHVPVISMDGNTVTVTVGSAPHPMVPQHYIMWIYLQTCQGGQRKCLQPGEAPQATFQLSEGETVSAVFEYCNLHGLWKTQVD
jgi:superoxide reductase